MRMHVHKAIPPVHATFVRFTRTIGRVIQQIAALWHKFCNFECDLLN